MMSNKHRINEESKIKPIPTNEDIKAYETKLLSKIVFLGNNDRGFITSNGGFIPTKNSKSPHCDIEFEIQNIIAKKYNLRQFFRDNDYYNMIDHPITQYIFN